MINECYSIRSLYNYLIVLLFENFGYTMGNESFEFLLGKPKMPEGHGTMGVGVSGTVVMKDGKG